MGACENPNFPQDLPILRFVFQLSVKSTVPGLTVRALDHRPVEFFLPLVLPSDVINEKQFEFLKLLTEPSRQNLQFPPCSLWPFSGPSVLSLSSFLINGSAIRTPPNSLKT